LVKLAELFDLPLHVLTAEKLSSIAAMLPEIEKLSEPKQRELAGLIKDFLRNAARG
jgi:hypothetical protein